MEWDHFWDLVTADYEIIVDDVINVTVIELNWIEFK
jgi:hypothetical protein